MKTPQMLLLEYCLFAEIFVAVATLVFMSKKSLLGRFYALTAFMIVFAGNNVISVVTLFFRREMGISKALDYNIFATSNWVAAAIEYPLMLLIIYGVFRQAMKPLEGLHRAGKIVFRWVAGVSIALVLGMSFGPHAAGSSYVSSITGQIQQGTSILTLCLLLFVCLSTRYLGLTYRSYIFGASLGLGIWACTSLVETAWYSSIGTHSLYSPVFIFSAFGSLIALVVWGAYFAMPEPARQMILLPTTSPYFLWNSISEALGDEPGFVAIAGFTPDMLAPAEMAMLTQSSKRVREREMVEQDQYGSLLGNGSSQYQSLATNQ
jgi:hypothetical protein